MRVTLLRHAETPGNLLKRYIGTTDEPLGSEGVARVRRIAPDLGVKQVYTSALQRTMQTAQLLFPQAEIISVVDLNEMDFGVFEGKSAADMEHDVAYRAWVDGMCEGRCPDGESVDLLAQRCVPAFLHLIETAADTEAAHLTFVVHGGVIKTILSRLATPVKQLFEWKTDFCGGYLLEYDPQQSGGAGRFGDECGMLGQLYDRSRKDRAGRPLRVMSGIRQG